MARHPNIRSERDLYGPVRDHLAALGYTVRGEVKGCDITATRGDELLVIELKLEFNTGLLMQATRRQRAADSVYVAVPRPHEGLRTKRWRGICHLLRRLELGLLWVNPGGPGPSVQIVFHPIPYERKRLKKEKRAILDEMAGRTGDFNEGGSVRRRLMTAYRESAIQIACCLAECGPSTPGQLRAMGTVPKTQSILAGNVYGWFERVARGVYRLTAHGAEQLAAYPELALYYRRRIGEHRA
jgi:hypothetical protein